MPKGYYPRTDPLELFWASVNKDGPVHQVHGQCWLWTLATDRDGYGLVARSVNGVKRLYRAHRWIWERVNEALLPDDMQVLHLCDNTTCVNPAHLDIGYNDDNMADMVTKQRQVRGERQHSAKLTAEAVLEIRATYKRGEPWHPGNWEELCRKFDITRGTLLKVLRRQTWKHVTEV